jgi:NitT/TauT family transport system substrate-binding protein
VCSLGMLAITVVLAACSSPAAPVTKPAPATSGPAAAAPAAPAAPTAPAATPPGPLTPVKVGQVGGVLYGFYIGIERGYYREQGIDATYETFRTGSEMVPMIASGQLDVSQQAVVPATFNAVLRGLPIKAILDASHSTPEQRRHAILVRKELADNGSIRSLPDLVGRKVATSSLPGGLGIDVDRGLRRTGNRVDELDQTILPFPDMPAALANGSVDAAVAVEPSITTALNQNSAVVLGWLSEYYAGHQIAVQVIGPSLVEQPELTRRLSVAYLRAVRDWNDAIKHGVGVEEMAALLTPHNRLDPAVNADLLRRHGFTSIDPEGRISKESITYDMNWYLDGGHIERAIDVDQFVDSQYADAAVKQLGPYAPPRRP